MKIAVVYQYMYPQSFGGGEKRLFEVFSRFPLEDEIDWFVQYNADYRKYPELDRFNIINIENKFKSTNTRSVIETLKYCLFLTNKVDFKKYDIVHIGQMPFFHIMTLLLKYLFFKIIFRKTPLITLDWWEFWGNYWKKKHGLIVSTFGRFTERFILFFSQYLVVISTKTQQDIKPYTIAEVCLIHNGVDFKKISKSFPLDVADVIILGRLEEWKNPMMGVKVFESMLKRNKNLKMNIVGAGSYLTILKKYVEEKHIEKQVKFFGPAKDDNEVYSLIKGAKLMFLFSKQEGGGSITLFESNACGVPVATAYFENGIDEELVTEDNGFFYLDHDVDDIAKDMLSYLESHERQEKLSTSSVGFVKQFDWEIISKQYHEFFKKILMEQ